MRRAFLLVLILGVIAVLSLVLLVQVGQARQPPPRQELPASPLATQGSPAPSPPAGDLPARVEPALLRQLLAGDLAARHRVLVELDAETDLVALPQELARADRQALVVAQLQATASQSQAELLALLQARQAEGRVDTLQSFWVVNGLVLTADAETILEVAARPEVRIIREDRWRRWIDPPFATTESASASADGLGWNLTRIRADLAWSALGLDGSGVTVAIMDTGVDWLHPALRTRYRGYKADGLAIHHGNWASTTGEGQSYPVDGSGHGTHVAGIVLGSLAPEGPAIGVAPGARWIAVKMLNDDAYGYESWIHAAFEWLLAPGGDPALAPDVVNASWGSLFSEDEAFRPDLQALRAAGIVPVFAAGNDGPSPRTISSPASYPEAIAVGSTDDRDVVATSSSRGPSPWFDIKPEVVAPGTQIRSSLPGGAYRQASGTSMATAHVTGLVALLLQADPTLSVAQIEGLLTASAVPLGEQVPSNSYGWGRIDAYEATSLALEAGFITGRITTSDGGQPLPTAEIRVWDRSGIQRASLTPDDTGRYRMGLPPGVYRIRVQAFGYKPQVVTEVWVETGLTKTHDFVLLPQPSGLLRGQVRDAETGAPLAAEIAIVGAPVGTISDARTGEYSLSLPAGSYILQAVHNGHRRHDQPAVEVVADRTTRVDLELTPAPTLLLVDSGRWYNASQASYYREALAQRNYVHDTLEITEPWTQRLELNDLRPYDIVIWSAPQDSPGLIGAGDVISDYLSLGGRLFLSGQDVGLWDGGLTVRSWHPYYHQFLKATALADDAGRDDLVGLPDGILQGLRLGMNSPDSAANQETPDLVAVRDPRAAASIGRYGDGGVAAIQASGCQSYRTVYLAAGLEGLGTHEERSEVLDRSLTWLASPQPDVETELYPSQRAGVWLGGESITYTVELRNLGRSMGSFALALSPSEWPVSLWDASFSQPLPQSIALAPCLTQTLGVKVSLPPKVAGNATDVVTLTAYSLADPTRRDQTVFQSKTPAPVLLVDDHRWVDTVDRYEAALEEANLTYDVWRIEPNLDPAQGSPQLRRLRAYPVVIWFTSYDWYGGVTEYDEALLAAYLDQGGRLLLSSQDYLYSRSLNDFGRDYIGVASFREDLTTTHVVGALDSPVKFDSEPLALRYQFYNWSDALRPSVDARVALWGQHGQPAALTRAGPAWKSAFFAFPLEALQPRDHAAVVGATVAWLAPLGDSQFLVDRLAAKEGERLAYTLLIRNTSSDHLRDIQLSNRLPSSTSLVAGSLEGPAVYDPAGHRLVWQGSLDSGAILRINYSLQLNRGLESGMMVRNVAHLLDETGLAVERAATAWVGTPDLSASTKEVSADPGRPTQVLTYTLTLRNNGLRSAQVQLSDPVPPFSSYLPASAWASFGQLTAATDMISWQGSVPAGEAVTIAFPAVISPEAGGLYVYNRASVGVGQGMSLPLETYTWVVARAFLPFVARQP